MEKIVNLGLIQMSSSQSVDENLAKAVKYIKQAANQGAQIVCLQELFKTPYFCKLIDNKYFELAEQIDEQNPTVKTLSSLARQLRIVIIGSMFEKRARGLYHNTAVVIDADGSFLGKYRKMHIPDDTLYCEKFYFAPGDLGYKVFNTRYARIGVLICWDQWYPEAARLTAMRGAEIIFYPTAIGYSRRDETGVAGTDIHSSWQIVQQGHAVANACFVATVNRIGFEPTPGRDTGIEFWGGSFVANPAGEVTHKASRESEEVLFCPVDLSMIDSIRNYEMYPFRDRRVDSYQDILKRFSD